MKSPNALRLLSLAGLGTLVAASAFAQEGGYYYGGISAGQTHSQIDEQITLRNLMGAVPMTPITRNEQDTAYKVFGGYQFNRNLGVEIGYFNLAKFGYSTVTPTGAINGQYQIEGGNLDLVGTMPLGARWALLGRVGAQYANTRNKFDGLGMAPSTYYNSNREDINPKIGVGMQYEITRSLFVRAEAERYRISSVLANRGDVNMYSVSLVMPIGRAPLREKQTMAQDTYVAPAPVAPPAVVALAAPAPEPVPAPPLPRKVQFSADSLFTFDKSVMRADGKAALDTFANELKGTRYDTIAVEGNTDRLGSTAYNQRLSEQRAQSVKAYLTNTGGIDAAKISAVGRGKSNPVTKPEDCKGNKATPALIACLQPDRRVDVVVSGER